MKHYLLPVLLSLTIAAAAAPPTDISVHVTDSNQVAVPGAAVSLISSDGGRRTVTTDSTGSCRFIAVAAGQYFVQGEAAGFDVSPPRSIGLKGNGNMDVTLALGVAQVHSSIVVTASGTPQTTDEVSKALTVVDGGAIALRANKSVGEALVDVPGLRVQQLGGPGSTTYFKIRGLRNADTAVLVDGLRLRDAAGTQADASGVLQDLVITDTSRIEVLRGAGSSLYGTNATGGVVNIVTDEGGGRTRGSIGVDGGSLGSVRGTAQLAGGLQQDRIQYSFGVMHWNVMSGMDGDSPARNTSEQGQVAYRLSKIASFSARVYAGDSFSFVRLTARSVGVLPKTGIVEAVPVSLSEQHRYEAGTPLSQLTLGPATFLPAADNPDSMRARHFFTGALRFTLRPSDKVGFTAQYQNFNPQLEEYRQQFERIANEAKELTAGLTEAQFNWRPAPEQWSIEECLAHLTVVGQVEVQAVEKAVDEAKAKEITGTGPFEYPVWERFILRETEPPVRLQMPAPKRFVPAHGQPITGILPTFLHVRRQFTIQTERADGLDLRRVKVPTPITRLLKLSLGATLAQAAAHERRHMAQARRVRERLR